MTFDADPGTLQLRIAVQGGAGGTETLDTDVREVKVPDLTAPQVAHQHARRLPLANAREFQELNAAADPLPTAAREFRRTERLLVRFDAYGPGNSRFRWSPRASSIAAGSPMADLPVRAPQGDAGYYQVDLPLAGLRPASTSWRSRRAHPRARRPSSWGCG